MASNYSTYPTNPNYSTYPTNPNYSTYPTDSDCGNSFSVQAGVRLPASNPPRTLQWHEPRALGLPLHQTYSRNSSLSTGSYPHGSLKESHVRAFHSNNEWKKYLNNIKGSNPLMVIDFMASWCTPCKFMDPAFTQLAAKFTDAVFVKIDVDELMNVAQEFDVQTLPTFVLIKHGNEVDKITGAKKDELEKKVEKHMLQQLDSPAPDGPATSCFVSLA